jgi:hypothetical protein
LSRGWIRPGLELKCSRHRRWLRLVAEAGINSSRSSCHVAETAETPQYGRTGRCCLSSLALPEETSQRGEGLYGRENLEKALDRELLMVRPQERLRPNHREQTMNSSSPKHGSTSTTTWRTCIKLSRVVGRRSDHHHSLRRFA